jgi:uncharacterized membrane protein YjjB (DUF3815 family)
VKRPEKIPLEYRAPGTRSGRSWKEYALMVVVIALVVLVPGGLAYLIMAILGSLLRGIA